MKYINKLINNVPVTIINTNKFKSVFISLYFKSPVTKENVTTRSLLRSILIESCKKYNTSEKLYMNTLENYDAYYLATSSRMGNYIVSAFKVSSLMDKYTKKNNLKDVIDTFCEIVFNPLVDNNHFDKDTFKMVLDKKRVELQKIVEESRSYAERMLYKNLNNNKCYSYVSDEKYLDNITEQSLYEEYKKMLEESEVSLIVCGDIDEEILNPIIDKINNNRKYEKELIITNDDEKGEIKEIIDNGYGMQNILNMVMYIKNTSEYELNFIAPLYRIILGGYSSSRLFNKIREENSLAYYSFARLEKDDSFINIIMGISKESYKKVKDLTFKIVESMKKITNEELENAKKEMINALLESQDDISNVVSREYNRQTFHLPTTEEYINKLNSVTKKEVETFAKKIKPNLIYFLQGGSNE